MVAAWQMALGAEPGEAQPRQKIQKAKNAKAAGSSVPQ